MAQLIRTICDVHESKGVEVDATTWEVLIRKQGTRTQPRDIDLCEECSAALEAVAAIVLEVGRTDGQTQPRRAVAASTARAASSASLCPVDGCTSGVSRQNLGRHLRQVHNMDSAAADEALAEALGVEQQPTKLGELRPCPDCEFSSTSAAGLGAHRYAKHGYTAPSRQAVAV